MNNFWSQEEDDLINEFRRTLLSYRKISLKLRKKGFSRTPESIRKRCSRLKESNSSPQYVNFSDPRPEESYDSFLYEQEKKYLDAIEEIRKLRDSLIKETSSKFVSERKEISPEIKVLALSDLHIPFENPNIIKHALKHHGDADVLVINGDILDQYMVSKWPKSKSILIRWEYEIALEWMRMFSSKFKKVVLTSGNHEGRLQSFFSSNIDPAVHFLVSNDILCRLAHGHSFDEEGNLQNQRTIFNIEYDKGLLNWYAKIGKCIFAHPKTFSGVPMKTSTKAAEYFLGREDFQCIVLGHTHKSGAIIWKDLYLIEQGACCAPLDYETDGRLRHLPQAFGYAVVYMDKEGNVDFNRSTPVYYGSGSPVKEIKIYE